MSNLCIKKKLIAGLYFFLIILVICGCRNDQMERLRESKESEAESFLNCDSKPVISKEVAILIARGFVVDEIFSEFGLKRYNEKVSDKKTYWVVEFVFKDDYKHLTGGGAGVEVDKKTGKVIRYAIGK